MESTIQVNFNRPMPLFPLPDMVLLPHAVQQLHVFEKRYRQMVQHCLDGPGQFAVAAFAGTDRRKDDEQATLLRPAVCVAQIMQHHRLKEGRFQLLVLGVCRATIDEVIEPEGERKYRTARLRLLDRGLENATLPGVREELKTILSAPTLIHVRGVSRVMPLFQREDVPTQALLELLGAALFETPEAKYSLLAEPDPRHRAGMIRRELKRMDRLVRSAEPQMKGQWPKGMSWN